jgi:glycosyltransferase involved in cell wall biosynthesis
MNVLGILGKGQNFGERTQKHAPLTSTGANIQPPLDQEAIPIETKQTASPLAITLNPALAPPPVKNLSLSEKKNKKIRVMLCGTYPVGQSNGYSRVVYYVSKYLGLKEDIQLTIYGFQNFRQTTNSQRSDIPPTVILHDALATEEPKRSGFGDQEIAMYLKQHPQDIVIIFNDMVITSALTKDIIEKMTPQERSQFKLISYMDQVYPYQKPEFIKLLNDYFDGVIAFTPYWRGVIRKLGLRPGIPTYFFPHGFDSTLYYPIPKKIARLYYDLPSDAFIILNLNRNQPRKRWDHTIMAYADVVERHIKLRKEHPEKKHRPIRLMIGTAFQGFWDLLELYEHEIKKRDIPLEVGREYITTIAKPQQLSDRDINIMYNACDIGVNTCEGEGFGLCQFEHLAVGCPQVAANIGGFREFLHKENSTVVEPKWFYYVDKVRDGIGGYAEVSDPKDVADAIWKYYTSPKLVIQHGYNGRKEILQHYSWETMVQILHRIVHKVYEDSGEGTKTPASL